MTSSPPGTFRVRDTPPRVATYSPGMVGFGHIRRNASIAQALRASALKPAIVMIAEAWQAGALPMPPGVDCVTLPALRKHGAEAYHARFLDLADGALVELRSRVIRSTIQAFEPNVLIVDHLPLGAAGELGSTLEYARQDGHTRCVLGLRDVLQDRTTVQQRWSDPRYLRAVREYYDAIWIYGDPAVFDPLHAYGLFEDVAAKVQFTGYLDQSARLEFAPPQTGTLIERLPPGPIALCLVGGGNDGDTVAEAFIEADLPSDMTGVVVTGPYMPEERRQHLLQRARHRRVEVIEFLPEPAVLVKRAERVVAMGGYNTMCEVLSFEKHALIVPRVKPRPEQMIRAQRMRDLGLVEILYPDELTPAALSAWLKRDLGPPPPSRRRVDLGGLTRIPTLLAGLLGEATSPSWLGGRRPTTLGS